MKKILVTGASGYIAKHIILQLLQAGYSVRGSVRAQNKEAEIRDAMTAALGADPAERLEFVHLDLNQDTGWNDALAGMDGLFHTASPFVIEEPKDHDILIRPAVDGTLRALGAAKSAGVSRVILTSSVAAILGTDKRPGQAHLDEQDWSDVNSPLTGVYNKSKTLAERAAWDYAQANNIDLTTINPCMVLGAPVGKSFGASLSVIERILSGKDPAVPFSGLAVVHVKDVALAHIRAFENDASIGERIIAANEFFWFKELSGILKQTFPSRKIPTRQAPNWLIKLLAKFDKSLAVIIPHLGRDSSISNAKAQKLLGIKFISGKETIIESGRFLVDEMGK